MPLSMAFESSILRDPALPTALAILAKRCQPSVLRLLERCSRVLQQASIGGGAHLQIPALHTSGVRQRVETVPGVWFAWQDGVFSGGIRDQMDRRIEGEQCFQARGSFAPGIPGFGHCMYGQASRGGVAQSWRPEAPAGSSGSSVLEAAAFRLNCTSFHSSTNQSKLFSTGALSLQALRQRSRVRCDDPLIDSRRPGVELSRGLHSSSSRTAAGFENIGEASSRRATALEYKISADDAIHRFQDWSAGHWLGPISRLEDHAGRGAFTSIRAAYQPFWVFDAKVTTFFTGEIGFDYSSSTYNSSTKRYESSSGTVWRQAPYTHSLTNTHAGDNPEMQVYASYRYRKAYMQRLRGPSLVAETRPLSAEMLAEGRELDEFGMKREIAWRRVREKIQQQEVGRAEELLKTTYHADRAQGVQLQMKFDEVRARAVYVPAYILEYEYAGQAFRAVVHGATGEVGAERHLSAVKVGGLVATGLATVSVGSHYLGWGTLFGSVWGAAFAAGLAALAGYAAERWWPRVSTFIKELQQRRDVFEDTARAARAQGAEEAGLGGDDDEERERQEHWQRQRRYREWQGFGDGAMNAQLERILREFEEQFRRQGGPGFGPFGVPPQWEQQYDRSGFDARRPGERQRQQQQAYEEQARRGRPGGQYQQARQPGYSSGDPLGYYKELGLAKGARSSEEEIKAAFRRLALEWHPDRHSKDPNGKGKAEEKFKRISQAYQVLRDPRKKTNYDAGIAG